VVSTRLGREQSHRDLQVVTVGTGTCTERLGCEVGMAAVCWLEERATQKPLYVSGCLRLVEDFDNGRVQIGDRGVLGNPNRTLLACGACDCHDAIIQVAFPALDPPPLSPPTRRLGEAIVGAVEPQQLVLEDMSCPTPIPEDDGGCEACPYGVEYRFSTMETSWEAHMALAMLKGCHLASIKSKEEQAAAVLAMEPFIGFPYQATENFQSSFAYLGAKVVYSASDPAAGRYTFEWVDGSGQFEVLRGTTAQQGQPAIMTPSYSNFITSDPNGGTAGYEVEPYLALSLNEHGSTGITRGDWIDFSARNSPALYKCCAPPPGDFSTCFVKGPPTVSFEY
jgi:hypothetical protein